LQLPSPLPDHPRLLARKEDWSRLRTQIEVDGPSKQIWDALVRRAGVIRSEPPLARVTTGKRLLMVARQALERVSVLALVSRISGDDSFGTRAIRELMAICRFPDWNPAHYLDTAELCLAVSIGLDWLHDRLTAMQRDEIATALIEKGLKPSLDPGAPSNWWLETDENWAQVCHGGLAAAAIVVADRVPELSQTILDRALSALPKAARSYAPDGAYPEGPMYWSYGTSYHVVLAAALTRLTGDAQGTDAYPGFAESADYISAVTAPSGAFFNYADCAARRRLQPHLFWLAARFARPDWLPHDLRALDAELAEYLANPSAQYWHYDIVALALLWRKPAPAPAAVEARSWFGRGPMPVATYRWGPQDFFLGIKGGSVGLSHSHMDVGSFVFEALGERWAIDPGMQDYESLESAGVDLWNESDQASQRWQVFRIGLESHNVLRFDGMPQLLRKEASVTFTEKECVVDISPLCAAPILSARRRFVLHPDGFSIEDAWTAENEVVAISQWLTRANIRRDGNAVILEQNGKRVRLEADSAGASFAVEDVSQPANTFDAANPGLTRLTLRSAAATAGSIRLRVTAA
jgi:hypothetical protein